MSTSSLLSFVKIHQVALEKKSKIVKSLRTDGRTTRYDNSSFEPSAQASGELKIVHWFLIILFRLFLSFKLTSLTWALLVTLIMTLITVSCLQGLSAISSVWPWTMTLKINRVRRLVISDICTKFDSPN